MFKIILKEKGYFVPEHTADEEQSSSLGTW